MLLQELDFKNQVHPLIELDQVLSSLQVGHRLDEKELLPNLNDLHLKFIKSYTESLTHAREHYKDMIALKSLWYFLMKNRFKYPQHLFNLLKDDDVVEVYSMQHTQVFRSHTFYKHCSYTLSKLYGTPWFELFSRDKEIENASFQLLSRGLEGQLIGVQPMNLPQYWIKEVQSDFPFQILIEPGHCCMLHDHNNHLTGYITSSKIIHSLRK